MVDIQPLKNADEAPPSGRVLNAPSILRADDQPERCAGTMPDCFRDLNLDQVASAMTAGRGAFNLNDFIWAGPQPLAVVRYRQNVMRDLDDPEVLHIVRTFGTRMADLREKFELIEKLRYTHQKTAWFLTAAGLYRTMLRELAASLQSRKLNSEGLRSIGEFLAELTRGPAFRDLSSEIDHAEQAVRAVRYVFHVRYGAVSVLRYDGEDDYGQEIADTFERFRTRDVERPEFSIPDFVEMDHVEAQILEGVRQLHPQVFEELLNFFERHRDLVHPTVTRLDRELQFYIGYIDYIAPLKAAGLAFCYPSLDEASKAVSAEATFDIALGRKLVDDKKSVVTNDFAMKGKERIFVVSGPNQGGKTTFARTFGQIHYLASLGLPVPGREARLLLFDHLFTHFEREENIHNLRGKLQDDLVRIHDILERATNRSIIIMNEIFTSTTLRDALFLATRILGKIIDLDSLAVCVTFIDELSRLSPATVSLVSTVDPDHPATRTFKIVRRPADGLAHAMAIAEKYRLTSADLQERLRS